MKVAWALVAIIFLGTGLRLLPAAWNGLELHGTAPLLHYRAAKYAVERGLADYVSWYDHSVWYPLGAARGGAGDQSVPVFAALLQRGINAVVPGDALHEVCALLPVLFSGLACLALFQLVRETEGDRVALLATGLLAVVPCHVSNSMAGESADNSLVVACWCVAAALWSRAVSKGSRSAAAGCAAAVSLLVSTSQGHGLLLSIIALHAFSLLALGRLSRSMVACFTVLCSLVFTLVAGFASVFGAATDASIWQPGHVPAVATLVAMHLQPLFGPLPASAGGISVIALALAAGGLQGAAPSEIASLVRLGSSTALEASLADRQPASWSTIYLGLHVLVPLLPLGVALCCRGTMSAARLFLVLYASSVMCLAASSRHLLFLTAPPACAFGAVAAARLLTLYGDGVHGPPKAAKKAQKARSVASSPMISRLVVGAVVLLLASLVRHSAWVVVSRHSAPASAVTGRLRNGTRVVFQDFRESYAWLAENTAPDARVLAWKDHGHAIRTLANRTTVIDSAAVDPRHLSLAAAALVSSEQASYPVLRQLNVDYVLVVFGGKVRYSQDDLNKFVWMVRIANDERWRDDRSSPLVEADYFGIDGQFRVDRHAPAALKQSVVYKLCYSGFEKVRSEPGATLGWDRVRRSAVGRDGLDLEHFREVYTSPNWLVRIYKVLPPQNRGQR